MLLLALDPADDGAAVLFRFAEGGLPSVSSACAWRLVQRGGESRWAVSWYGVRGGFEDFGTPGEVGYEIASRLVPPDPGSGELDALERVHGLVIEGPYVGKNPHTALRIARFGGLVAGGIQAVLAGRAGDVPPAYEIQPTAWRAILGLSAPNRAEAKARSLAGVPVLVPTIAPALRALGRLDHLTDAAGIGLVGTMFRAWEAGFEDRVETARLRRAGRRPQRG